MALGRGGWRAGGGGHTSNCTITVFKNQDYFFYKILVKRFIATIEIIVMIKFIR